ncbi:ABC transporter permease [Paenibacillus sp. GCM10027628]|uniref:ABC transporter permease n=1 Tax=Paenibacillus sp. GCM10027628 TaxID=3273413 RepID=UPI0036358B2E
MSMSFKLAKYSAIGRVTLRNQFVYVIDFLVKTIFLGLILYIFTQLWGTTYRGEGTSLINGYSYKQMIWYLIFAESLVMAFPSLTTKIEQEVKNGDVGYRLTRPVSYLLFHYVSYLGEVWVRWPINLTVGSLLGLLLLGFPSFGWGWLGYLFMALGGITIQFLMNMILALCAFWLEETRGLEFVYHKLLFTVGGMMLPLEMFPEPLQRVCAWLPFQAVLYFASKTAVRFDGDALLRMLGIQGIWIVILTVAVTVMYRRGVRKLNVNGG